MMEPDRDFNAHVYFTNRTSLAVRVSPGRWWAGNRVIPNW